jgi:hypothetical protein
MLKNTIVHNIWHLNQPQNELSFSICINTMQHNMFPNSKMKKLIKTEKYPCHKNHKKKGWEIIKWLTTRTTILSDMNALDCAPKKKRFHLSSWQLPHHNQWASYHKIAPALLNQTCLSTIYTNSFTRKLSSVNHRDDHHTFSSTSRNASIALLSSCFSICIQWIHMRNHYYHHYRIMSISLSFVLGII